MRYVLGIALVCLIAFSFGDVILLKNGLKIEGEVLSIGADSVAIKTTSGTLNIAVSDVAKIETITPERRVVSEGAIPQSIRQVGYGCLGGVVGGATAGMVAYWAEGFGDERTTATVILGSVVIGIIAGVAIGGGK